MLELELTRDPQADSVFSGISTFGRVKYHPCLANDHVKYDIAFIGSVARIDGHFSQTYTSQKELPLTRALRTAPAPDS